jgi:carbonic anhydrase/acetyltransferase-like protein (isoleucine patch superfamily)
MDRSAGAARAAKPPEKPGMDTRCLATNLRIDASAFVAPGAAVVGEVTIGVSSSVWFNATVRGDMEPVVIGSGSNVQDNCVVHVDRGLPARIGSNVSMGHGAIVHGATIEDEVLVAMKAVVLSGCHIGPRCIIGAGAVVPEGTRIPAGSLVLGVPARIVRPLRDEEIERVLDNARSYVALAAAYRSGAAGTQGRP